MSKQRKPCTGTPSGKHRWRIVQTPELDETHRCTKCPAIGMLDSSDVVRVVDLADLHV